MKKRKAVVVAGMTAAMVVAGTAPAFATHEVGFFDCNFDPTEHYFAVTYEQIDAKGLPHYFDRCYADAGEMDVNQDNVVRFRAGANSGWLDYLAGDGYWHRHTFTREETGNAPHVTVSRVHID